MFDNTDDIFPEEIFDKETFPPEVFDPTVFPRTTVISTPTNPQSIWDILNPFKGSK
jgi:hypothetical protein